MLDILMGAEVLIFLGCVGAFLAFVKYITGFWTGERK